MASARCSDREAVMHTVIVLAHTDHLGFVTFLGLTSDLKFEDATGSILKSLVNCTLISVLYSIYSEYIETC